jgi:hypothetical protein
VKGQRSRVRNGTCVGMSGAADAVVGDMTMADNLVGWRHDVVDRVEERAFDRGSSHVANGGEEEGSGGMEVGKMGFGEMTLPRRRRLKRLIGDDKEGCGDMTLVESSMAEAGGHLGAQNVDSEVLEEYDMLVQVVAVEAEQHV